jgi:hypothetical protein
MKCPTPPHPLLGQGQGLRVIFQKAPPQGWGICSFCTREAILIWGFSMAAGGLGPCMQVDSPKNLALGVRPDDRYWQIPTHTREGGGEWSISLIPALYWWV